MLKPGCTQDEHEDLVKQNPPGPALRASQRVWAEPEDLHRSQVPRFGGLRPPTLNIADINGKARCPLHEHTWKGRAWVLTGRGHIWTFAFGRCGPWREGCPPFRVTGGLGGKGPERVPGPPPRCQASGRGEDGGAVGLEPRHPPAPATNDGVDAARPASRSVTGLPAHHGCLSLLSTQPAYSGAFIYFVSSSATVCLMCIFFNGERKKNTPQIGSLKSFPFGFS